MFEFAAITDVGPYFQINDDRVMINGQIISDGMIDGKSDGACMVAAVADGVGGLQRGYEAAEIALEAIAELGQPGLGRAGIRRIMESANQKVIDRQNETNIRNGIMTTIAAIYFCNEACYVINAGDSRVYRYRDGTMEQLSKDHSAIQNMIDTGEITVQEARSHPKRNVVTKCLGAEAKLNARIVDHTNEVLVNDMFLICSDGISDCLTDGELLHVAAERGISLTEMCKHFLNQAIDHGSTDNISICVIRREN
jgi:serine/threonine protein phosphatase PrpC